MLPVFAGPWSLVIKVKSKRQDNDSLLWLNDDNAAEMEKTHDSVVTRNFSVGILLGCELIRGQGFGSDFATSGQIPNQDGGHAHIEIPETWFRHVSA